MGNKLLNTVTDCLSTTQKYDMGFTLLNAVIFNQQNRCMIWAAHCSMLLYSVKETDI